MTQPPEARFSRRQPHRFTGKGQCRWCGAQVKPPRRSWCGDACVREYVSRQPDQQRIAVLKRDGNVCQSCGQHDARAEVDHIVPVCEGGGSCGLENLRTLCRPCHRKVTRELRARLAAKRRGATSTLLLLLLAACAAPLKFEPRTPESVAAQRIGDELSTCLDGANGWPPYVQRCGHLAAAACLEAGLERGCGPLAMWWKHVGRRRSLLVPPMPGES